MLKQIRIAFISPIFDMGGIQRTFLSIAEGLREKGYEFHMINTFMDSFQQRFRQCGKCVYIHENLRLLEYLRENKIDIVQTNGFARGNYIAYTAGVPRIVERLSGMNSAFRFEKTPVDCIISSTNKVFEKAVQGYPHKYIKLIQNGIDLNAFSPETDRHGTRTELGLNENDIAIGYCGRIAPEKCIDKLINVCAKIIETNKNVKLLLLGTPYNGYTDLLQDLITRLQIEKHVLFIPPTEHPADVMRTFDIGVIASGKHTTAQGEIKVTKEGLSNAVMEKMAFALPIVATDSGELSSLVQDGYNGFIVDTEDMDSFYDRLMRLINDNQLRREMGRNGRKIIEEKFSLQSMIDKYDTLYRYVASDEFRQKYPNARQGMRNHYLGTRYEHHGGSKPKNVLIFRSGSKPLTDRVMKFAQNHFERTGISMLCHEKSLPGITGYTSLKNTFVYDRSDTFDLAKMNGMVEQINQVNWDSLIFMFNDFMAKDENQNVVDIIEAIHAKEKILYTNGDLTFLWPQKQAMHFS
ncbi:MAG: glycosyltransferase family 1 protein [Candidatus Auribacter fodinae]|jgi:glycosyltransferase involved in cell wall biosynthesis|uniref:Glycosyltransferase family 1 protein n=1 Tax=Candidatus Auribacter fodinae TaxID=2093366 RepID=A0A3A4RH56_9BACT|nr:MAG: glycosyltransferase family 1 protein [Candidatus Auribacter fodinae]